MNLWLRLAGVVLLLSSYTTPSKKTQFQQDRKELMAKIEMINKILTQTESKKKTNIGQLSALRKKEAANYALINSLSKEVKYINQRIHNQQQQINSLQTELAQLKREYAQILFVGSKSMRDINILVLVFAADSFQEFWHRLQATRQYIKIRKSHFEAIRKVDVRLKVQLADLERKVNRKHTVLYERQNEQQKLNILKQKQHQVVQHLEQEHDRLLKELNKQNKAVWQLDKLISNLVRQEAEEARVAAAQPILPPLSVEAQAVAAEFARQRGALPWPVKTGFISNKFGTRKHPVLRNVQVENLGIDIQTKEGMTVRAIARGIVKTTTFVPGMNGVVIMQHGNYHTVYAKLANIVVKVGQEVPLGEPLGLVYTDQDGVSSLQFQIWQDGKKLNPAIWITKEPTSAEN